uniref:Uncharacterized protein n=1 Tax=Fibrocapsa japonica TaxID=94617 RepID=A0A7S2V3C3_9STRA|mmetsp:Transcript_22743/g.33005  ORF Transcript_22743/g.33005 Transcript_22743/m.33005 type:complete len:528 (+) Transcript_22743:158-1741(+)
MMVFPISHSPLFHLLVILVLLGKNLVRSQAAFADFPDQCSLCTDEESGSERCMQQIGMFVQFLPIAQQEMVYSSIVGSNKCREFDNVYKCSASLLRDFSHMEEETRLRLLLDSCRTGFLSRFIDDGGKDENGLCSLCDGNEDNSCLQRIGAFVYSLPPGNDPLLYASLAGMAVCDEGMSAVKCNRMMVEQFSALPEEDRYGLLHASCTHGMLYYFAALKNHEINDFSDISMIHWFPFPPHASDPTIAPTMVPTAVPSAVPVVLTYAPSTNAPPEPPAPEPAPEASTPAPSTAPMSSPAPSSGTETTPAPSSQTVITPVSSLPPAPASTPEPTSTPVLGTQSPTTAADLSYMYSYSFDEQKFAWMDANEGAAAAKHNQGNVPHLDVSSYDHLVKQALEHTFSNAGNTGGTRTSNGVKPQVPAAPEPPGARTVKQPAPVAHSDVFYVNRDGIGGESGDEPSESGKPKVHPPKPVGGLTGSLLSFGFVVVGAACVVIGLGMNLWERRRAGYTSIGSTHSDAYLGNSPYGS